MLLILSLKEGELGGGGAAGSVAAVGGALVPRLEHPATAPANKIAANRRI
jgi:hypothetical protein